MSENKISMEGKTRNTYSEVVPFIVMVIMEGCTIGLTILAKTAITNGMSPFVFIVYTNALATIILLPCSFLLHNKDRSSFFIPFCVWSCLHGGLILVLIYSYHCLLCTERSGHLLLSLCLYDFCSWVLQGKYYYSLTLSLSHPLYLDS